MSEIPSDQPFSVSESDTLILRIRHDAVPPLGGFGRLIGPREILVSIDDAEPLLTASDEAGFVDGVFNNSTIYFPLVPELLGAAVVDNEDNWGFGIDGLDAAAFKKRGAEGDSVRIGIADSGMDATHPMFAKLLSEDRLVAFAHFDKLGKKVVQTNADGSVIADADAKPTYGHWHGTHCAGILVGEATDGMAHGLAPQAQLAVTRVLELANEGSVAGVLAGLWWLTEQKCDVVSISLGMPGFHEEWWPPIEALLKAGTVVVAAVGNEALTPGSALSRSPANYLPTDNQEQGRLIAVGAHDQAGAVWDESSGEKVDWSGVQIDQPGGTSRPSVFASSPPRIIPALVAPGVDIISASPNGLYRSSAGSSMATPHLAALIALVLSELRARQKDTSPNVAADLIVSCLKDVPPAGEDTRSGKGRVDNALLAEKLTAID